MALDGYSLGLVTEDKLSQFGEWLIRTRGLTPRPVSDYKSRVRRVAKGVDMSTLTANAQASLETAVRAFLEFRGEGGSRSLGRQPGAAAHDPKATEDRPWPSGDRPQAEEEYPWPPKPRPRVQHGAKAVLDAIDDRGVLREAMHWLEEGRPSRAVQVLDRGHTARAAEVRQEVLDASGGLELCDCCGEPNDDLLLATLLDSDEVGTNSVEWVICDDCAARTGSTALRMGEWLARREGRPVPPAEDRSSPPSTAPRRRWWEGFGSRRR